MIGFWSLYSGGKDSTVATSVLDEAGMLRGVVTFDTGISAPGWLDFVIQSCKNRGWPLEIYKTPESYDELVMKYGFPGPGMHGTFMNYLKGRCVRLFKAAHPGEALASGVRRGESQRRWRNTKEWSVLEGVPVYAPIYKFSTEETWKYFNDRGFIRSPAYEILCISGDCLCGAYATKGERDIIAAVYPEVHQRLCELEKSKGEKWGARSCKSKRIGGNASPLCTDCDLKQKELNLIEDEAKGGVSE